MLLCRPLRSMLMKHSKLGKESTQVHMYTTQARHTVKSIQACWISYVTRYMGAMSSLNKSCLMNCHVSLTNHSLKQIWISVSGIKQEKETLKNNAPKIKSIHSFVVNSRLRPPLRRSPRKVGKRVRRRIAMSEPDKGPSIYDVRKILEFFDSLPHLSAFGTDLQY